MVIQTNYSDFFFLFLNTFIKHYFQKGHNFSNAPTEKVIFPKRREFKDLMFIPVMETLLDKKTDSF